MYSVRGAQRHQNLTESVQTGHFGMNLLVGRLAVRKTVLNSEI